MSNVIVKALSVLFDMDEKSVTDEFFCGVKQQNCDDVSCKKGLPDYGFHPVTSPAFNEFGYLFGYHKQSAKYYLECCNGMYQVDGDVYRTVDGVDIQAMAFYMYTGKVNVSNLVPHARTKYIGKLITELKSAQKETPGLNKLDLNTLERMCEPENTGC